MEAERNDLAAEVAALRERLEAAEADRARRLEVIQDQERQLQRLAVERANLESEVQVQQDQIEILMAQLRVVQQSLQAVQNARAYRLLRRLGRWKFADHIANEPARRSSTSMLPPR
jgi:hypothetical protein